MTSFSQSWQAKVLNGPPMIAPARHVVLPQVVPGEEDAMARGALWVEVRPAVGGSFLLQCALGFAGAGVTTGVWATPEADVLLAVAGGYAYRVDTRAPEKAALLAMRPVVAVLEAAGALVLQGFSSLYVLEAEGEWETGRLSWEGLTGLVVEGDLVRGLGWHMRTDREMPFKVDLRTRVVEGGAFLP